MNDLKKRILIVSNMYPSSRYPHYGVFVQHTEEILRENGFSVGVAAVRKQNGKLKKLIAYLWFYLSVLGKGLMGGYDVIYAHYASHTALPLLILRRLKKIKTVVNVHGNDIVPEDKKDERFLPLVRQLLDGTDALICPSEYFKQILKQDYSIPDEKIMVYPSGGVNTELFRKMPRMEAVRKLGLDPKGKYIGYVSRIEEKKGWDLFLEAAAKLKRVHPELKFIVVGDGSQMDQFNSLAEKLGVKESIVLYKLLSQQELVLIYNVLDIFVFPTYRKSESLGLVGLEAMACQTVTVLPDSYGPSSYGIDGENAFLFKTGDAESLSAVLFHVLQKNHPDIGINARKAAMKYNHSETDPILVNFFMHMIKEL